MLWFGLARLVKIVRACLHVYQVYVLCKLNARLIKNSMFALKYVS